MVRRKWSLKGIALGASLAAAAGVILTFYVWYQTESVRLGIEISQSDARIRELEISIEMLKLRKAALLNPGRVERIARQSLGLVDPPDEAIIYQKPDAVR